MLGNLWMEAALQLRLFRDRLANFWHYGDRTALIVAVVPAVAATVFIWFGHLAYVDHLHMNAELQRSTDLRCLAENVYYEGRGEPADGQRAVAEVTMNRVASPRFPDTVCAVVHEKRLDSERGRYVGAFSWTELRVRRPAGPAWQRALAVAASVYEGTESPLVPDALYYHAVAVTPKWARAKKPLKRIGHHVFYR